MAAGSGGGKVSDTAGLRPVEAPAGGCVVAPGPLNVGSCHNCSTGRFSQCLDLLKERLADPTGDRICESLRIAREVGGSDLGRLLRTLSSFLRDDARTRAELETRQSWVVNSARLAVAAPWILLGLISLRTESIRAFNAPSGWVVLAVGGVLCLIAYRLMLRLGRLPVEGRVLR